jgi:hypothetical protein
VKAQLEELVMQMHRNGITYSEAVREFKKAFLATVLKEHNGNQCKAAVDLRIAGPHHLRFAAGRPCPAPRFAPTTRKSTLSVRGQENVAVNRPPKRERDGGCAVRVTRKVANSKKAGTLLDRPVLPPCTLATQAANYERVPVGCPSQVRVMPTRAMRANLGHP